MGQATPLRRLIDRAALPYRQAGRYAWYYARGKLTGDPVFAGLLRLGLVPPQARILDLGCGQGLLGVWLNAACLQHGIGVWPAGWPAPTWPASLHGIELSARDAARARWMLGATATVTEGDIRHTGFGEADLVVMLDVLHYVGPAAQEDILARIHTALAPHGTLLLRVGDADGGWRFRIGTLVDLIVMRSRNYAARTLHCRNLAAWLLLLRRLGFTVTVQPMSEGTPFANNLLVCTRLR